MEPGASHDANADKYLQIACKLAMYLSGHDLDHSDRFKLDSTRLSAKKLCKHINSLDISLPLASLAPSDTAANIHNNQKYALFIAIVIMIISCIRNGVYSFHKRLLAILPSPPPAWLFPADSKTPVSTTNEPTAVKQIGAEEIFSHGSVDDNCVLLVPNLTSGVRVSESVTIDDSHIIDKDNWIFPKKRFVYN